MSTPFPWESPDCVHGIDVSSYQHFSPDDWEKIAAAGVVMVSIEATNFDSNSGRFLVDAMLDRHQAGALSVGCKISYYGFLHSNISGRLQAEHFARTIEGRPRTARWYADFEDQARISPDRRRSFDCLCDFMATGKRLLGEDGGIYSGPGAMALLASLGSELDQLAAYDYWVAHYRVDPANGRDYWLLAPTISKPWRSASWWQITGDKGPRIAGIDQDVDRDVFLLGGRDVFDAWCRGSLGREVQTTFPATTPQPIGAQDRAEQAAAEDDDAEVTKP